VAHHQGGEHQERVTQAEGSVSRQKTLCCIASCFSARRPDWVKQRHQSMSATTAAFAGSSHGILTAMSIRPRSHAVPPMTLRNVRANGVRFARRVVLTVPPSDDLERGPVARLRASAIVWPAHGVHQLRQHRCGRSAELEGAATAREPDRDAMAVGSPPVRRTLGA
jgi:hypothetical protein